MEREKSAIMQMLMGEKGHIECVRPSEEYRKAQCEFHDKYEELRKQLQNYPKLLALFNEMMEASDKENAISVNEVYIEAFSFGLTMGQEVFGSK